MQITNLKFSVLFMTPVDPQTEANVVYFLSLFLIQSYALNRIFKPTLLGGRLLNYFKRFKQTHFLFHNILGFFFIQQHDQEHQVRARPVSLSWYYHPGQEPVPSAFQPTCSFKL